MERTGVVESLGVKIADVCDVAMKEGVKPSDVAVALAFVLAAHAKMHGVALANTISLFSQTCMSLYAMR